MPKYCYIPKRFNSSSMTVIDGANAIINDLRSQGYTLSLRQLYYQFVSKGWIENTERSYKNLGTIISNARLAGLIDWYAIEDRSRFLRGNSHWEEPASIIEAAANSYQVDRWKLQPHRVEVWVEKEALVGILSSACSPLDVSYFACKGYVSQSEMWGAAMRLERYYLDGQKPVIIYLGDHDPSGMDMTDDIENRMAVFGLHGKVIVERIALNMDQIEEFQPPPNPAKMTDTRFQKYRDIYGDESWELDALNPSFLDSLITEKVLKYRDKERWEDTLYDEERERAGLEKISENYAAVMEFVEREF